MIDRLIAFSVQQRMLVIVLSCVFVILGLVGASKVPIDAVPDVTNVQVQVLTPALALGPEDVETLVSAPIERAMAGLPGLEEVRSTSRAGISAVTVAFSEQMELYRARQLVSERLAVARRDIPEEYGTPQLGPATGALGEIYHFEVKGKVSLMERRSALDWIIVPRLRLVPGVVEVNTMGGEVKSLEITLDAARMSTARVSVPEVLSALSRNHLATGGAYLVDGREHVTVRGEGRIKTAEDLGSVVVETRADRTPLFLRDLGEVGYAPLVRYGAVTRDGRDDEAVIGIVIMLAGANSGRVVEGVRAEVAEIQKSLPPGVKIEAYHDRMDLVERTIHTVTTNMLEASALVLVVLFVMLVSFRGGVVVAIAIPLALLGAFLGMWLGGVAGNLISLGAIDFGLVVDGAIIIVENAMRRLSERRHELGRILTDAERSEVVISASREVRGATAFGEAIIALVYLPVVALQSVEGRMFRPMALTVLFALATAFVLSLTLIPALASLLLPRDAHDKESPIVHFALRLYRPALRWSSSRPLLGDGAVRALVLRHARRRLADGSRVLAATRRRHADLGNRALALGLAHAITRADPASRKNAARIPRSEERRHAHRPCRGGRRSDGHQHERRVDHAQPEAHLDDRARSRIARGSLRQEPHRVRARRGLFLHAADRDGLERAALRLFLGPRDRSVRPRSDRIAQRQRAHGARPAPSARRARRARRTDRRPERAHRARRSHGHRSARPGRESRARHGRRSGRHPSRRNRRRRDALPDPRAARSARARKPSQHRRAARAHTERRARARSANSRKST